MMKEHAYFLAPLVAWCLTLFTAFTDRHAFSFYLLSIVPFYLVWWALYRVALGNFPSLRGNFPLSLEISRKRHPVHFWLAVLVTVLLAGILEAMVFSVVA